MNLGAFERDKGDAAVKKAEWWLTPPVYKPRGYATASENSAEDSHSSYSQHGTEVRGQISSIRGRLSQHPPKNKMHDYFVGFSLTKKKTKQKTLPLPSLTFSVLSSFPFHSSYQVRQCEMFPRQSAALNAGEISEGSNWWKYLTRLLPDGVFRGFLALTSKKEKKKGRGRSRKTQPAWTRKQPEKPHFETGEFVVKEDMFVSHTHTHTHTHTQSH